MEISNFVNKRLTDFYRKRSNALEKPQMYHNYRDVNTFFLDL